MSYSETSVNSQGRFWTKLGQRLPLNKTSWLGIAAVLTVAAAVFLTWMLAAGPWSGGGDSFEPTRSTIEPTRSEAGFDGDAFQSATVAPGGFGGDSTMAVTVTDEAFKGGPRSGRAEEPAFPAPSPASSMLTNAAGQRQIISQGSMSVEVPDVSTAAARVRAIAEAVGGFVEQLSSNGVGEFQQSTLTVFGCPKTNSFRCSSRSRPWARCRTRTPVAKT